jgi:SPP1 gp7 family putative phage head morphogenesis protein
LHTGKLKPTDLHADLITKTYNELATGAGEGYGKNWEQMNPENTKTVQQLKQNIYKFSGAKAYHQLAEMNSLLVDEKGKIRSFSEFKRKVDVVHETYNRNYLQAEYQTAKRSAQASRQWKDFENNKDLFPNLKYMTVGDDRVRHDHSKLHGIVKPVGDAFWDTYYPPNGWRCRCYVKSTTEGETKVSTEVKPDNGFGINVGKINQVFDENSHPYFVFPAGDAKTVKKAFENFKLTASYGKARYTAENGAKVYVSPFADARPQELIGNYKVAIKIAEQLKYEVKLAPHIDGRILINQTSAEYLINGKIADRKAPKGSNIKNIFRKSAKQQTEILVIDLQNTDALISEIKRAATEILKYSTVHPKLKEVIIVSKNRKTMVSYSRSELKK